MKTLSEKVIGGVLWIVIIIGGIMMIIGGYAKIWEELQPFKTIDKAKIVYLKPYDLRNDIHWTMKGYRIKIDGEEKIIDFSLKKWDASINIGDSVKLVVRDNFPLFGKELDGVKINVIQCD